MDRQLWEVKSEPFDPLILEQIALFKIEDLSDDHLKQNWLQVAKRFSKMKLTAEIVQSMTYEQFMTIRCIMSATLGDLSRRTDAHGSKIAVQEQALTKLKYEEEKLTEIYNTNLHKAQEIKQKLERLKQQDEAQDELFGSVQNSYESKS